MVTIIHTFGSLCFSQVTSGTLASDYVVKFRRQWQSYLHALGSIEGTERIIESRPNGTSRDFMISVIYLYPKLVDSRGLPGEQMEPIKVTATNEKYRFEINRGTSDDPWEIRYITGLDDSTVVKPTDWKFPEQFADPPSHLENPIGYTIFNTLGVGLFTEDSTTSLPYLVSQPGFHITEFSVDQLSNDITMSFIYKMDDFPESTKNLTDFPNHPEWKKFKLEGTVILTTDYFLISHGIFHREFLDGELDIELQCFYDMETYRVPLPKTFSHKLSTKEKGVTVEEERIFDLKETNPKDNSRFTLSAYGLPEPDFGGHRPSRLRYIIFGIGLLMLVIGAWRMIHKRRENV